jgi:hypothetical protein
MVTKDFAHLPTRTRGGGSSIFNKNTTHPSLRPFFVVHPQVIDIADNPSMLELSKLDDLQEYLMSQKKKV